MKPRQYKLNLWFDAALSAIAGFGVDVLCGNRWCHVLNEQKNGPLLLPTGAEAHELGKAIVARAKA